MPCGAKEAGGVYRLRYPQQSPFYQLVERFFAQFEAVYEERCGLWRPILAAVVGKFLECGDLKHGFARVRCPKCREEFFVACFCRVRCFCPSCHEKRALEKAGWVGEHVCAEVPHRQFVFTIPKRLRIYFRFDRRLLGELCRAAARTMTTVYRAARTCWPELRATSRCSIPGTSWPPVRRSFEAKAESHVAPTFAPTGYGGQASPIRASTSSGITAGIRTRPESKEADSERRRPRGPEIRSARPRLGKPAKGGRR